MSCCLLALLLGTFLGVSAQTIHQWPPVRVQLVGSPLSLECIVKGESNPYLYWYRQAEGGPPQLLFYSLNIHQVDPEAPRNFTASRPQDGQFILSSQKLLLSDSGFYLCAWGLTPSRPRRWRRRKRHELSRAARLWTEGDQKRMLCVRAAPGSQTKLRGTWAPY
uniref:Ig-like domain-containing protein n=1 Tax=Felis catus TaxID=9685 RepID=A0ABI8ABH8_FELCA